MGTQWDNPGLTISMSITWYVLVQYNSRKFRLHVFSGRSK